MERYKKSEHLPETYVIGLFMVTAAPVLDRGYWRFQAADSRGRVRVCTHSRFGKVNRGDYFILAGHRIEDNGGQLIKVDQTDFCQRYEHRRQFYPLYDHIAIKVNNLRNKLQTQEQIDLTRKDSD